MTAMAKANSGLHYKPPRRGLRRFLRRVNWPLLLGSLIVLLLVLVAIKGPEWAPKDPMLENYTLRIDGKVTRPPYPAFEVPGFPLGTDSFGRDIFSRLLWAVRPTVILVTTVALIRLILGILIGLSAGWSTGRIGRGLDSVISIALSVPVLIVALMGIAAVGIEHGMVAFIVGLAITGWAETARLVGEQTRSIKSQSYVEAAQALGASDLRILGSHILRQIMPLVWMLLAFEVSSTLFVIAELGFLGYFIGGGVWIEIFDFTAVNTTGLPELGQMLATALVKLTDPSALIAVGSVLFLAILGFNLLGEGLRQRLDPTRMTSRQPLVGQQLGDWIEERLSRPVTNWVEDHALQVGLATLIFLVVGGWSLWWGSRPQRVPEDSQASLAVPGGHFWVSERHDAQGSRWVLYAGPSESNVLWTGFIPGGPSGSPVVSAVGTVIAAGLDKFLVAYHPDGNEKWNVPLPEVPVGSPALGPNGEVYVSDTTGGLTAFSPDGSQQWHFAPQGGREGTSGPVVASDGTIFYTRVDSVQAVSPTGSELWRSTSGGGYLEIPPILSAGESYVFLKNMALAASNGIPLNLGDLPLDPLKTGQFTDAEVVIGADRRNYLRLGHEIIGWRATEAGVEMEPGITWNYQSSVAYFPAETGVTPEGLIWMFYAPVFGDTRVVWLDKTGRLLMNTRLPRRQSRLVGVDHDSTTYFCSSDYGSSPKCYALELGGERPKWEVQIMPGYEVTGGALAPGRLYVASGFGTLYAIGTGTGVNP